MQSQNFIEVTHETRGFSFLPCTCYVAPCMVVAQKETHFKITPYAIFKIKKCAVKVQISPRFRQKPIVSGRNCLHVKEISIVSNFYYNKNRIENQGWPKASQNAVGTFLHSFFYACSRSKTHNWIGNVSIVKLNTSCQISNHNFH